MHKRRIPENLNIAAFNYRNLREREFKHVQRLTHNSTLMRFHIKVKLCTGEHEVIGLASETSASLGSSVPQTHCDHLES